MTIFEYQINYACEYASQSKAFKWVEKTAKHVNIEQMQICNETPEVYWSEITEHVYKKKSKIKKKDNFVIILKQATCYMTHGVLPRSGFHRNWGKRFQSNKHYTKSTKTSLISYNGLITVQ